MRYFIIAVFFSCFISCKTEHEPTKENINEILSSKNISLKVSHIGGSMAGSFKHIETYLINDDHLIYNNGHGENQKLKMKSADYDTIQSVLYDALNIHEKDKKMLRAAGCGQFDQNYYLENNRNRIVIKPPQGNLQAERLHTILGQKVYLFEKAIPIQDL